MQRKFLLPLAAVAVCFLTACSTPLPSSADLDKLTKEIVARSFRAQGQAQLDKISQHSHGSTPLGWLGALGATAMLLGLQRIRRHR